jgi:hypothetical protein
MSDSDLVYCIDDNDIIFTVSENWEFFARANGWDSGGSLKNVVGHFLWDFIEGLETRYLYEEMFRRVRFGKPCGPIPFRCDSPKERRFLELLISPLPDDRIEITSTIIRIEHRNPVRLLDKDIPRSNDLLRICSMCKKIAIAEHNWVDMDEAVVQLRLFEADRMPGLTHGLCPSCYEIVMTTVDELDYPIG